MIVMQTCTKITFKDTVYYDRMAGTTNTTNPLNFVQMQNGCPDVVVDGLSFLVPQNAFSGNVFSCPDPMVNFKLRNIGTRSNPLNFGGPETDITWSRSGAVLTVTFPAAHGINVSDTIIFRYFSDTAVLNKGQAYTVTAVPSANTLTMACSNAGAVSGTGTGFQCIATGLGLIRFGPQKFQRVYGCHTRTTIAYFYGGAYSGPSTDAVIQGVWGDEWLGSGAPLLYTKNSVFRQIVGNDATSAGQILYGNFWSTYYHSQVSPPNIANVAWTRSGTTVTVTSPGHRIAQNSGSPQINVTASSSAGAMSLALPM